MTALSELLETYRQASQTEQEAFADLPPEQLADSILKKEQRIAEIMGEIREMLNAE